MTGSKGRARVRAADVAAAAGVSTTAVSFVLNGRDAGNISSATRDRVLKAAEELDYRPNYVARSLRRNSTSSIGLVTDAFASSPFGGRLLAAATETADTAGAPGTVEAPATVAPSPPAPQHLVLTLSCPDRPGIVHAVSGALARRGGNITESQQFGDPESGLFFMRVSVVTRVPRPELEADLAEMAEQYEMHWALHEVDRPLRTLLMVSKEAHCLSDLLFRATSQGLPIDVVGVVGNHEVLRSVAEFYGVPFHHIPVAKDTKEAAEAELLGLVDSLGVELVVLARYMQILSPALCERLHGGVINIHHSFLPSFKGAKPYHQAHDRGVKLIGATAHYVTADLDEGPIIEQDVTRASHADSALALQRKGQDVERRVLAQAVKWHAEHRVLLNGRRTVVFA